MKTVAFIFARGGSKGLVNKNILELGGVPLVGHSIQLALEMPGVEAVFVSSEDADIKRCAREYGARIIDRPAELAKDDSPEWLAWRHAIGVARDAVGPFDRFLSLPATSPLRSAIDVDACLDRLDDDADMVITVTPAARNPWFNMVSVEASGIASMVNAGGQFTRRQDAPDVYDMTTVAYVTRPEFILSHDGVFSGSVAAVVVPRERAVDIDDAIDLELARTIYGMKHDS
jgi:CMP-N-acetylneuraminic acid synthetase